MLGILNRGTDLMVSETDPCFQRAGFLVGADITKGSMQGAVRK